MFRGKKQMSDSSDTIKYPPDGNIVMLRARFYPLFIELEPNLTGRDRPLRAILDDQNIPNEDHDN